MIFGALRALSHFGVVQRQVFVFVAGGRVFAAPTKIIEPSGTMKLTAIGDCVSDGHRSNENGGV